MAYPAPVPGTLLVIATPLGNLDDLSDRARRELAAADVIACEDTRRTRVLLDRCGIDVPTVSCHRFNEAARLEPLLARLAAGGTVALVSDGGTPGIADPGSLLVRRARDAGATVRPIPGPSALVALLSASGLDADRFVFDGFLPHRAGERRRRLRALAAETRTVVVYETPHRIRAALSDLAAILGDRTIVLGRELTKLHETILRGTAAELAAALDDPVKGEIALAIAGGDGTSGATGTAASTGDDERATRVRAAWRDALAAEDGDRRRALRRASRALGLRRAELQRALDEIGEGGSTGAP